MTPNEILEAKLTDEERAIVFKAWAAKLEEARKEVPDGALDLAAFKAPALGFIRHLLTTAGGALVAAGHVGESDLQTLVGAAVAVIGVLWSVREKKARKA